MWDFAILHLHDSEETEEILINGVQGKSVKHPMNVKVKDVSKASEPDNHDHKVC